MINILISTAELATLRMVLKSARAWAAAEAAERGQAIAGAGLRLAIEEHDLVMMDQHEDQSDDKLCPGCERAFLVDDFTGVGLCGGCLARQRLTAGPPEPPRPVPPEPSRADQHDQPGPEYLPLTSVRYLPDEPTGKCDKCGAPGSMMALVRPYGGQWQCIDKEECAARERARLDNIEIDMTKVLWGAQQMVEEGGAIDCEHELIAYLKSYGVPSIVPKITGEGLCDDPNCIICQLRRAIEERIGVSSDEEKLASSYHVVCAEHGKQLLTDDQYTEQMLAGNEWVCPVCGESADLDDGGED